jgi:HlyD family secretion protein
MSFFHTLRAVPLVFALVFHAHPGTDGPQPTRDKPELTLEQRLELFEKETPAGRLRLVEKLPRAQEEFHKVASGPLVGGHPARGFVEATIFSDVVCGMEENEVRIKWVIKRGTLVKKGDRVLTFDDSNVQERLAAQKAVCLKAEAAKSKAEDDQRMLRRANQVEIRLGEIAVRIAELEKKQAAGADKDRQDILDLRVEQARLELERTRAQLRVKEKQAEMEVQAAAALARQEAGKRRELEERLTLCVRTAPRDGVVDYEEPFPIGRIAPYGGATLEKEVLMRVCDERSMRVSTILPESLAARVKKGQKVVVQVDAYPGKLWSGTIAQIDIKRGGLKGEVAIPTTRVTLDEDIPGLKLGMSAEVRYGVENRTDVVGVPVQAILRVGKEEFCFVKTGAGIERRTVQTGIKGDSAVEIKSGLKQGDRILRQPDVVLRQLDLQPQNERD